MKKSIFFVCLSFVIIVSTLQQAIAFETQQGDTLKVMTYNIHHANPPSKPGFIDLEAIANVIRKSGADLVALQEIDVFTERSGKTVHQAEVLGEMTGMYSFFAKGIDYQGGEYGVAILSKYPFIASKSQSLPMDTVLGGEPRVLATVEVKLNSGTSVIFACTHLDLKSQNRELQANYIVDYFANTEKAVILGGDFNATPKSTVIRTLDKGFKRSTIKRGFTIPVKSPTKEIDYLMHRPDKTFSIIHHQVIAETYASDHLPVCVTYFIKKQ